ncbi:MAG: ABC transporter permease subunit, partial [Actinomycetota bacterium]
MTRSRLALVVGVGAIVGVWAGVAARQPTVLVPGPDETLERLVELAAGPLWAELGRTGWRSTRGAAAAIMGGVLLGSVTGANPMLAAFLRPTRAVLTGIPPIITVVLVSLWIGIDGDAAPAVVGLATLPLVWLATDEAVRAVDPNLREMAAGLHVGWWWRLTRLTAPAISPPVVAASAFVAATSIRLTIMAELLS